MSNLPSIALFAGAVCLLGTPAQAIDDFFPSFGNKGIDVVHYDLQLDVKPNNGRLDAVAKLNIIATKNLSRFTLDLANLSVSQITVEGQSAGFSQAGDKLTVRPRSVIAAGDVFDVAISYAGNPQPIQDPTEPDDPAFKLGWFKYGKASYALSEPVGASTFYPANDEPTDKATFAFTITVPADFTAVANGVLKSTQVAGDEKRFVWVMNDPMTTWLATVHVNRFKVSYGSTAGGTPLRFYTTAATPPGDLQGYALVRRMIPYFEGLVGRYPFDGYGSVVVDDPILYYALETQAMSTFPVGAADEAIVAHELAHQWFGNSVSVAQWADLWLAEGTATYFEVLWPNRNDPAGFRRDMLDIYDYVAQQQLGPAVVEKPEQLFSARTYYRGSAALYALQLQVGERTFFRILHRFATRFRGGNANSQQFIRTAVDVSGDKSVRGLLTAWLYEKPVPDLPGQANHGARRGPVAAPDVVGMRCGRGSHRGSRASCGAGTAVGH